MSDASTLTRLVDGSEVPSAGTYELDPSHTHVGFKVRHLMVSKVRGRFSSFTGTVVIGDDPLESSVVVDIDASSIDTRDDQRDTHLRSPDFLDAEAHTALQYRSTKLTPVAPGRWSVDGELTVRGVTQPVPLEVDFEGANPDPWGNERIGFSATARIDREAFGLTWNQALETGGVLVGNVVEIEIEAEAVRQR